MKKINRRGYGKRAVYTLLAFLFAFLCVFGQGREVYADDERNVFSKTGYFFVDIQGADGASTHVQVNVTYPDSVINKPDEDSYRVTLTMKDSGTGGDGKALKNSHGLSFSDSKGNAVKTVTVWTSQGNTADITKAETKDDDKTPVGTCTNENGEKRYKEKSFTVMPDIPFQYTKEAYTYVTGSSNIPVGSSRMNAEFYEWDGSGNNSLKDESGNGYAGSSNQGIWHGTKKARFYLQVNTSNTGARNDSLGTRHGTYALTMHHPKLVLTYLGNGSTSGNSGTTHSVFYNDAKDPLNIKGKTLDLSRTGYKPLSGAEWNTKADGKGTAFNEDVAYNATTYKDFTDGAVFKSQSRKLYAQWAADTATSYEIRLHSNSPTGIVNSWHVGNTWTLSGQSAPSKGELYGIGGLGGSALGNGYIYKTYKRAGSYTMTQSINISAPTGYHLVIGGGTKAGWWTTPSGEDGVYINIDGDANGKITGESLYHYAKDGVVNLYARWAGNSHVLTFNANGGTVAQGSVPIRYGASDQYNVSWNMPTRAGYIFLGWYTAPEGGTAVYNAQGLCTNEGTYWSNNTCVYDGDYTVYAHWKPNQYTVTLHAGTGIESVSGEGKYTVGDTVTVSATLLTGHHFLNWSGTYSTTSQTYTFPMPAHDVDLTANGEANRYTIVFDPNHGAEVTHIDSIETKYGENVTLPDAKDAYVKYTLDGVNITQDVISGTIVIQEDGSVLRRGKDGSLTAEDGTVTMPDGTIVAPDGTITSPDGTVIPPDGTTQAAASGTAEVEAAVDGARAAGTSKAIDAEPQPTKRAYASVFLGWSLEEKRDDLEPQWTAGVEIKVADLADAAGVTDTDGAVITLYAVWDDCPWIQATNLYYTLEQAQSGFITVEEILSHATASDREDGSPISAGVHADGTSFTIPDYAPTDFTQFRHEGAATENLTVTDSVGSVYEKQITVYVADTTAVTVRPKGTTRFIDEKYYNQPYEQGGLEDTSIWKTDTAYRDTLLSAFRNFKNDTPIMRFLFSHEKIEQMKQYVAEHGIGNSRQPGALLKFYEQFCAPNLQ